VVAKELRIASERVYDNYQSMAAAESKREDKIDAVCVVTPTDHHYEVAKTFLQAGMSNMLPAGPRSCRKMKRRMSPLGG
jgi:predicted dehydrogenase